MNFGHNIRISIIGTGALGSTLARALDLQGFPIHGIFNRTLKPAKKLASILNVPHVNTFPVTEKEVGDLVFITVPDEAIPDVTERLARNNWDLRNIGVVHCSGNEPAELLQALHQNGALTAAFHPLQTFNSSSLPDVFQNIYVSLQGDEELTETLEHIVHRLGARPLHLTSQSKSYLHAAAVVASNYIVTLMDLAGDIAALGNIDHTKARRALFPLLKTTAENTTAENLSDILSGPIARGDVETVKTHISLLEQDQRILSLYKRLGQETVRLARQKGTLTADKVKELQNMLSD